ncbi:TonB-dependent receptor domain-containing protein [Sphingomonas endophytica]|uniref:TonB-dependent receptor n=1 Tax=Sphingomonas endophytica TaxID=869719 RepID=A0A147I030_9SPHN|nr:TonB-dependent receptor [Sphingomonas endophytica]KTT70620.1 TonB-dependent receptor [Sphingomonas endophytica]
MPLRFHLLASIPALLLAGAAHAQTADAAQTPDTTAATEATTAEDIVVTGVAQGRNRLDTSVSVSSLDADLTAKIPPRNTAEILRNLPGVRVEASGGEGNANISVRGLPVASGGSKFLQLQEDGLPVLEFGDIIFGNADIFIRNDLSLARIESVRGGSASTFASNSPGGIINFISKTGEQEGGSFQLSSGLDYREYRADFAYGGKIDDKTRYELSGFYRLGDGPRDVGYDAMRGGQIKANITREFDRGYIRVYGKYLDDRSIAYLPNPVRVTGGNGDPTYQNIPGFSINEDTLHSRYIGSVLTLDGNNDPVRRNIGDGMHPVVKSVGFEGKFDIADGWNLTERFRYSDISGDFVSPFPASVGDAQTVANGFAGAGAQLYYASGPLSGQRIATPGTLGGNGLLASVVLFDVKLNSLNNITNDLRLNGKVDLGGGALSIAAGIYNSRQDVKTDWLWTSFFQSVQGNGRSVLVDIRNAAGVSQTAGGTLYSASFFGNCCRRSYDMRYTTNAPFAQLGFEVGRLNIDGSVRYDFGSAKGSIAGDLPGATTTRAQDMNGDGVISAAEQTVAFIPNNRAGIDYDYSYLSYSAGLNYRLSDTLAAFARYSRGGRVNADRLLFGPTINLQTGGLVPGAKPYDFVKQAEGGLKFSSGPIGLYATVFNARTQETNYLLSQQQFTSRQYEATGVELEGRFRAGPFSLSAAGTYTDAKITRDATDATLNGNRPQRQAAFVYQATPQLDFGRVSFGANVIGTTSSYTQPVNQLKMPAYTQVNGFLLVRAADNVSFNLNANNIFNVKGITEAEDAAIPSNGLVRARSINGRTIAASVRFDF